MNIVLKIVNFYVEGFRNMTIGRTLWAIILIKLVVIFLILKVFFFPNYIKDHASEGSEAEFVHQQIVSHSNQQYHEQH
ncbi:MAG: DUF4492 domain-containing protein [Bacteroidaceae bacterium]|nr:DUF4492 domain-containing protein [Bacteroidaceae bacterium]